MGREWYWRARSSRRRAREEEKDETLSGCMCSVFQFFDFHQFQLPLNQQRSPFKPDLSLPVDASVFKGVEAPRNSLESEEASSSSSFLVAKEEANFKKPMSIQIKRSGASNESEISSSPGPKTPTLVARLMGLDLIPEAQSPASSTPRLHGSSNLQNHKPGKPPLNSRPRKSIDNSHHGSGTYSLPETPRISSARRSDVDYHHRLSLQINKENCRDEMEFPRFSYHRRRDQKLEEESKSQSHYARQIVKQVKESVSRKVGLDITNTIRNRDSARDELVNQIKSKKMSKGYAKVGEEPSPGKILLSTTSSSPRLRFVEPKNKSPITGSSSSSLKDQDFELSKEASENHLQCDKVSVKMKAQKQKAGTHMRSKKEAGERLSSRMKKPPQTSDIIRNKQEEPFIRTITANRTGASGKKCKKTPLSDHLLNVSVSSLVPVKKDPSTLATKMPQKQESSSQASRSCSQLSSCLSQSHKQETKRHTVVALDCINEEPSRNNFQPSTSSTGGGGRINTADGRAAAEKEEYHHYITTILQHTGVDIDTKVSFTAWFSPSHPLNPSLFLSLEQSHCHHAFSSVLNQRCTRKLIFHLVDELLAEMLKPFIKIKPWVCTSRNPVGVKFLCHDLKGSELLKNLCTRTGNFPAADCRVLEDIDALVGRDMPANDLMNSAAYEEEGESIVTEIERDILDTLVHEVASHIIVV